MIHHGFLKLQVVGVGFSSGGHKVRGVQALAIWGYNTASLGHCQEQAQLYSGSRGLCPAVDLFPSTIKQCLTQSRNSDSCLSNETHFIEAANFQTGRDLNESPNSTFLFYIWGSMAP